MSATPSGFWTTSGLAGPSREHVEAVRSHLEEAAAVGLHRFTDERGYEWHFRPLDPDPRHFEETEPTPPPSRFRSLLRRVMAWLGRS